MLYLNNEREIPLRNLACTNSKKTKDPRKPDINYHLILELPLHN